MHSIVLLQRDSETSPRLRARIDATRNFAVVGMGHTIEEARWLVARTRPDMLMTDLRLQDGMVTDWLAQLRQDRRRCPHVLVTLVSHDDALLLEALRAGADGYWVHSKSPETLIDALEEVSRGESPMSPMIAREVLSHFETPSRRRNDAVTESFNSRVLTGTERSILQRVAQGYLIDEIARQGQDSAQSVARGIRGVYHKLQFDLQASGLPLTR